MRRVTSLLIPIIAFIFILALYGALPFVSLTTLGQAIWLIGFSQSFANQGLFSLHATNFGYPEPAAISFGLAAAYPASMLIRLGLHPADAYSLMHAFWLLVSFLGAWKIAKSHFRLSSTNSTITSVLWLSLPAVWIHTGYSALGIAIGLIPFYFWTALELFGNNVNAKKGIKFYRLPGKFVLYMLATVISVFMDGYSFVMFAIASTFLGIYQFFQVPKDRKALITIRFIIHCICFGLAYILYAIYIGKPQYEPATLDFFRGWGMDLSFVVLPTRGIHWLWDTLGLSVTRISSEQFGDSSIWRSTYSAPFIIFGLVAWWQTRRTSKFANLFLIIAIFGFYMALGPSLKVNSMRPADFESQLMPAEYAVLPTGNGWLSANVPGFKSMRAAYRWIALANLGLWLLVISLMAHHKNKLIKRLISFLCVLLIASNVPNLHQTLALKYKLRQRFLDIESSLIQDFKKDLKQDEIVAFLPFGNDFFVNYIASRVNIISYNIGGDKNLAEARKHWPSTMSGFEFRAIDKDFTERIIALLREGEADVVVLPYLDLLWAPHNWPTESEFNDELKTVINSLIATGTVNVDETTYYSTVRLK
ncbi:MAG: hypothetical protein AAF821_02100 [Cyanobacteria bacterium P01_D01_bin.156]